MAASASGTPIIGVGYFFITDGGVTTRKELTNNPVFTAEEAIDEARQNGRIVKCILVRDHQSKNVFAHAVPCKGNDEEGWVANTVADDCLWLGYKSMVLTSDNEAALLSLVDHIVAAIQQGGLDGMSVR